MATTPTLHADPAPIPRRPRRGGKASLSLFPNADRPGNSRSSSGASSPPPVPDGSSKPARGLVGIARLAASSPCADAKRGTEYYLLPVRSILNHCDSERVPFNWTVNPYRGCEFGCRYCYARYTHEYMELDGGEFERKIFVKQNPGELVSLDLEHNFAVYPRASSRRPPEHIAIGTATDPYQPAEREFGATRAILAEMTKREGLSISITTKSNQIVRDLDLLVRLAERSSLSINITITTLRPRLARMLEPRAPRPDLRLAAVRELRKAGLAVGVFAMPVLPGLTDREDDLDALARAARDAGAQWFAANVLFLMPSSFRQFLPFLEGKFPKLARQYRDWYARAAYAPEKYRNDIAARVRALRLRYSLGARPTAPGVTGWHSPQLGLKLEQPEGNQAPRKPEPVPGSWSDDSRDFALAFGRMRELSSQKIKECARA